MRRGISPVHVSNESQKWGQYVPSESLDKNRAYGNNPVLNSEALNQMLESENQVMQIKDELNVYNSVIKEAERYVRNQAGADEYNEDWITDSDSEASAGKADEIMQKVNESHAQQNLIFEGEEQSNGSSQGYDYDDYDYSSYDSGSGE